jgi:hypothetical protein
MRRLGLCAIAAAVVVAACGGNSSSNDVDAATIDGAPPDATPVVTLADICGTNGVYAQLFAKLISCNPAIDLLVLQGQGTPQAISALCHGALDPYQSTFDLPTYAQLQACLAYVNGTACLDLNFNDPVCNIIHGKVADSSGCDSTEQCADISYCNRPNGNTCGTCTPRLADGQACTVDEQCANGACVGTQCGHLGVDGDPCVITNGSSNDCLGTRRCNPTSHQCETKTWQLNDVCTGLGECGIFTTNLWCKPTDGTLGDPGQCAQFLALDATCDAAKPGAGLCDLTKYEWCNAGATGGPKCSPPSTVQDGQNCSMFGGKQCATSLVCSDPLGNGGTPGKCYVPGAKDAACGGTGQPPCGAFLNCISSQCEYTDDTPACP